MNDVSKSDLNTYNSWFRYEQSDVFMILYWFRCVVFHNIFKFIIMMTNWMIGQLD